MKGYLVTVFGSAYFGVKYLSCTFIAVDSTPDHKSFIFRSRLVSIDTVTVIPARKGGMPSVWVTEKRTGMRCTTLTQFPLAF